MKKTSTFLLIAVIGMLAHGCGTTPDKQPKSITNAGKGTTSAKQEAAQQALAKNQASKSASVTSASDRSGTTEDMDWGSFGGRRLQMTPEQAVRAIRSSLLLLGRDLEKPTSLKGKFVIERLDQTGFSCKMEMSQNQGGFVLQTSIKLSAAKFRDVTKLGIMKSAKGRETGVSLIGEKGPLCCELPFSNAAERDRLLSALAVVCGQLKTS